MNLKNEKQLLAGPEKKTFKATGVTLDDSNCFTELGFLMEGEGGGR